MPCFLSLWVFVIGYIARDALFSKFQNQEKIQFKIAQLILSPLLTFLFFLLQGYL